MDPSNLASKLNQLSERIKQNVTIGSQYKQQVNLCLSQIRDKLRNLLNNYRTSQNNIRLLQQQLQDEKQGIERAQMSSEESSQNLQRANQQLNDARQRINELEQESANNPQLRQRLQEILNELSSVQQNLAQANQENQRLRQEIENLTTNLTAQIDQLIELLNTQEPTQQDIETLKQLCQELQGLLDNTDTEQPPNPAKKYSGNTPFGFFRFPGLGGNKKKRGGYVYKDNVKLSNGSSSFKDDDFSHKKSKKYKHKKHKQKTKKNKK